MTEQTRTKTQCEEQGASASPMRVTVVGGGSFGTAIADLAARNGCDTRLWMRDAEAARQMQQSRCNQRYLPDFQLADNLTIHHDLEWAVRERDLVFMAVPSVAFREVTRQLIPMVTDQVFISLVKGIEPQSFNLMSEILRDELPGVPVGVLSGPNLAKEIIAGMPAGTVCASESEAVRYAVHQALASARFRVFANTDLIGVELAGALKNIYAVASGMGAAYGIGENTRAMFLTRALAEMSRFAVQFGANPLTFMGLAGIGDLYATCASPLSRNYRVGLALGQGLTLQEAVNSLGQTAEGVNTIRQVYLQSRLLGIYMPITQALYAVIFEGQSPLTVALSLMQTGHRSDVEFTLPHEQATGHQDALPLKSDPNPFYPDLLLGLPQDY